MSNSAGQPVSQPRAAVARLGAVSLVVAMALGSLTLWIGSPVFWLWLTSRLQSGTQASMGPYLVLLLGIIATSVGLAKALSRLNALYGKVTQSDAVISVHPPWHRMRGAEHESRIRPVTVLDVVMVVSVLLALIALAAWFIIVNPTPPGLQPGPAKK
jgi:hypothetical protein